ncbi:ABC transporter permease [Mucilaginibacter sp. RS28]|uniref:ABC transporter permease n=1 Tax=Mucilaginibacter straminoryzae TaxID=2932774 RepID=A0A9X1X572_9SPHI|nr:ABC transporter permease [Mucilaginibacter straminoryzae]MCJ8211254.1 ABC transporter permease [Mucilaginibacter straminoryzae]
MFRNYIKTAFRSLKKNKGFTFINVFGLALGLAVCLLIVFYVVDELGYDRYNTKADRIYRLNNDIKFGGHEDSYAVIPAPTAAALVSEFPEVENAARFRQTGSFRVKKGSQNIQEDKVTFADPAIFNIFTLPFVDGSATDALKAPHTAVINETLAKKYFGRTDVVGKTLVLNDTENYKITGVIKDIPRQSHFRFDLFLSMETLAESKQTTWLSNNFQTYMLLKPGANIKTVESKFSDLINRHSSAELQQFLHMSMSDLEKQGNYFRFSVTPLTDIHLKSNRVAEMGENGNIQYVYIFSAIAIFILFIACVNFMNLSTARSANRAREVGVRKVLGSARKDLVFQFLTESILITLVATLIAAVAAWLSLPLFNQMAGKEMSITLKALTWLLPTLIFIVVFVGCLAGSYPAFFLSGFQPIAVLKGKLSGGFKNGNLRSALVIFQFFISIFLIIGTLAIYNQLKYIQNKDLGFNREQVLVIKHAWILGNQTETFKQEIKQLPGVTNASLTGYTPTGGNRNSSTIYTSPVFDLKNALNGQVWTVDADYLPTMGMHLAAGRNFSKEMATDSTSLILNESAIKLLNGKSNLNQFLYKPLDDQMKKIGKYKIIGIVKDFNFNSLRENVTPLILTYGKDQGALNVRVSTKDVKGVLAQIERKWKELSPNQSFSFSFMDQDFDAIYRSEQRVGSICVAFTTFAIIIACLGLFGLAAYAAEQRNKEIGIRKVLGAGVTSIVTMLSKDFIKLVFIAILLAAPLAWWFMQRFFLESYAYRQNIQWWVVVVAASGAVLIAFVTISFQSIKAALINPVKSLRSE